MHEKAQRPSTGILVRFERDTLVMRDGSFHLWGARIRGGG
jgi:hypothetical protein